MPLLTHWPTAPSPLCLSVSVAGLFHKAILTSGCLQPAVPLPAHETHVSAPVAQLLAPLLPSPTSAMTAQALQGVSAAQLLCAQCLLILQSGQKQCLEAGPLLLQPIADGELLPFHSNGNKLQHVMEHGLGRGSKVQSVMVGHCRDEDGLFEALTPQHFHCNSLLHCRERVRHMSEEEGSIRGVVMRSRSVPLSGG